MTKGILKRHSLSGVSVVWSSGENTDSSSQEGSLQPKRVSFDGAEPAKIFEADEWDRSPAEVTLRLTYKDVVELRELNVSLVRTGPLTMERTASRRPTRQRTPTPPKTQPNEFSSTGSPSPQRGSSPPESYDVTHPSSPVATPSNPHLSPIYQYQAFPSQPLPPLLEDASSSSATSTPTERRGRGHSASASESYFTVHPAPTSGSPPGLSFRAPHLKGIASPMLAPPSPLVLPAPLSPRSPSPRTSTRTASPIPWYLHHSPRFITQSISDSSKPLMIPALSRRASVPDKLTLEAGKGGLAAPIFGRDSPSPTWKPLGLAGLDANSSSPTLPSSKNMLTSPSVSPVVTKRSGRSIMGWELKRSSGGSGRLGFGLVRKGST